MQKDMCIYMYMYNIYVYNIYNYIYNTYNYILDIMILLSL